MQDKKRNVKRSTLLIFAMLITICSGLAIWDLQKVHYKTVAVLFENDFSKIDNDFSLSPTKTTTVSKPDIKIAHSLNDGRTTTQFTGDIRFFSIKSFPVTPEKIYRLSVKMRILPGESGADSVATYVGFVNFSDENEIQTAPPNPTHFGVVDQTIDSKAGWQVYDGIFSGVDNYDRNQFHPDTKFVKIVAYINFRTKPGVTSEFEWIKLEEVVEQ